ncbi:MAG: N-acetyltransferase [Oscillospiraceae bacterium]|jgi:predicted N-acetyltransferase YhbS|nr:N-acetyltransferase [Oscillospiraceae bacterium]
MPEITLRREEPRDYRTVEELTRDAFWNGGTPQPNNEHLLAHKLRTAASFVPELDYVAEIGGVIVGNILYTKSKIVTDAGTIVETLTFGPLSVLPQYQNLGIGKALVAHTTAEATRLGYRAIVIFGHPDYYPRLGFRRASEFGITTSAGKSFDAHMALPLYDGALDGVSGRFYEDSVFEEMTDEEFAAFDSTFPPRQPTAIVPISVLYERLGETARGAIRDKFPNARAVQDITGISEDEFLQLHGVDGDAIKIIKTVLREQGYRWGK